MGISRGPKLFSRERIFGEKRAYKGGSTWGEAFKSLRREISDPFIWGRYHPSLFGGAGAPLHSGGGEVYVGVAPHSSLYKNRWPTARRGGIIHVAYMGGPHHKWGGFEKPPLIKEGEACLLLRNSS